MSDLQSLMPTAQSDAQLLTRIAYQPDPVSPAWLAAQLDLPPSTLRRALARLVQAGRIVRLGGGPSTRYAIAGASSAAVAVARSPSAPAALRSLVSWSAASQRARACLREPLGAREPVSYDRSLIDGYRPNVSSLLPPALAAELHALGKTRDQQPAGTYARNVLEQLLIDLSWSSSHLEGNRLSRIDTEELFKSGAVGGDRDAIMLLNHKHAIEYLVETAPLRGLRADVIHNVHATLMQDLLQDDHALGAIRRKVVRISDTVYLPTQMPQLLHEMFELALHKAAQVHNPLEAAFFLWVHLAYLQPFEDGNKRVSRLAANIPLMVFNCAPLSFLDVDRRDYVDAMLAVYELRDMAPACDLFAWTYRRSCAKYAAVVQAMGVPDPVRLRLRSQLSQAIGRIVRDRVSLAVAVADSGLDATHEPQFEPMLRRELAGLQPYNCARFRVSTEATEAWIAAGRPA
jgi:fido (protein-threonine AMPylation protein)